MTTAVWKFEIPIQDEFVIEMPAAVPLHFATQHGIPTLWALVDPNAVAYPVTFRLAGTGHPILAPRECLRYIGTCFLNDGALVFHLFQVVQ